MKARVEFLPDNNGAAETAIVEADMIEQRNGWIVIFNNGCVVFVANEACVKFCWLYQEEE